MMTVLAVDMGKGKVRECHCVLRLTEESLSSKKTLADPEFMWLQGI